ncbi:MAG TPA: TolC family outer membrane protein [Vitreimonas sp.]|uniref:TolC family outer membrane protein n=1 Tax=Vitreimonas sp. TaxID=3069702 RepID=UPI002D430006|nr:TolC family outer membrane protein [Vitreimonas sp.]HYD88878.1 TolC family outer membrane protein [Vitreimonas sp.]
MRLVIASLAALIAATAPASAETLAESMVSAVESNPTLAAQRQRLNATREALPQAWAAALPQVSLSAGATAGDRDSDNPALEEDRDETWTANANVSQLLFGSGRVIASTRAARAQIAGAVADYELAQQTLLLDVTRAYADVRQAQAVVAAREQTVSNLSRLLEYAQAQFDAGVVTRTDVAQAQARYAQARTQLVQAQGTMAAAVQAYQRLVGRPPSGLTAPTPATGLPSDLPTALDLSVDNSPVLIGAQADTRLADANVDVAAAQGRVNVTLEGGFGTGGDFNDDALESTSDSVGVRVSVPLFEGGAIRSRTRAQRALRSAANLDLASAQRNVQEAVTNAWTGLASARAAVESAREQVAAAELAYEGVTLEQETGLRSTVEVLDQEADLLTARIALAQAERDLVVAERQLLAAVGILSVQAGGGGVIEDDDLRGR